MTLHRMCVFGAACVIAWLTSPEITVFGQTAAPTPAAAKAPAPAAKKTLRYNEHVRPILAGSCFACHGPDSAARKAELRLDRSEDARKDRDAGAAIVPGNVEDSLIVERMRTADASLRMPPPVTQKTLKPEEIAILEQWIREGAEYEPHWSQLPVKRPAVPVFADAGANIRNPIDAFVLAKLKPMGLTPAPEADRNTLARRAALDLTGLPPAPELAAEFLRDTSPDAYEKYLDRLMALPQWGEHRARYWLDSARYADTHGIHFDNYREIWAYRDWVINAFNKNQPFDQFTIEQLAGDLLPNPTLAQRVATGFNRCNITTNEGGVIPEEYLVHYTRDRTETAAQVWLGLTSGCSVCHDHKFDPFSQRDFYSMAAFFNNTTQGAMDGNIKDTPPILFVPAMEDAKRWETLQTELAQARTRVEERTRAAKAEFLAWSQGPDYGPQGFLNAVPQDALVFQLAGTEGGGKVVHALVGAVPPNAAASKSKASVKPAGPIPTTTQTVNVPKGLTWRDGHIDAKALRLAKEAAIEFPTAGQFEKDQAFSYGAWINVPKGLTHGALLARMDDQADFRGWDLWFQEYRIGSHLIHKWPGDALKVVAKAAIPVETWTHVQVTYDGSAKAEGLKIYYNGALQETTVESDGLKNTIATKVPLKIAQRSNSARLENVELQDVRAYARVLSGPEVERLVTGSRAAWLARLPKSPRSEAQAEELFVTWVKIKDQTYSDLTGRLAVLDAENKAIESRGAKTHVSHERPGPPKAYILNRGEYDQRRDEVGAALPSMFPPMPSDYPRNRLGFAKWLLLPEHPRTARVTVNRFWQQVFGQGIVRTAGDFGIAGELPSNPELLDWLADEFRTNRWDVKQFFKLMLMSATYRQSAALTPEKLAKDPENVFLSRGPRFRMDAEMIRDEVLASSGLLVRKIGGPSVKPYQPPGVWEAVAMIGSNTRDYQQDHGDALYRRSMYTLWKRSAPPASMDIFNAPNRETCVMRRERTNTPLQALVTLNDPQFLESARILATTMLTDPKLGPNPQPAQRFAYLAQRLITRDFRPEELSVLEHSLQDLRNFYAEHPKDAAQLLAFGEAQPENAKKLPPAELAAWTMLVNELMNMDEYLNK